MMSRIIPDVPKLTSPYVKASHLKICLQLIFANSFDVDNENDSFDKASN